MTQQNKGVVSKIFYNIRKNRVAYHEIKWKRQKDLQFGRLVVVVVVGVVLVVVVVVVVLLLLPLLLNDQIANLFGAFTLFQGKQLCFFLCCKNVWYDPLILLRHTWIKTEKKGVVSKTFYHIRQNRVLSLEIKLEMASNPQFFFVSFHPLLLFIPCILSIFFFFFLFCYYHYYYYCYYYYYYYHYNV